MPLSEPAPREQEHTRTITMKGYRRKDGLWDIEGHLRDTKTFEFENRERGRLAVGDPVHDMWLRLTVDESFVIHDAEAHMDARPYALCERITPSFKKLKGVHIGPGWTRKVKELLGGVRGCTHLVEMLAPMGSVAFQTIGSRERSETVRDGGYMTGPGGEVPRFINACHALRTDSSVVELEFPQFYTGGNGDGETPAAE